MPTFTGKKFSNFYKNLLGIDQTGNTGVDSTTRAVQDGAGNDTALSLSDDVLSVTPVNDNTTGTVTINTSAGSPVFIVDTTNALIKVGTTRTPANTQYAHFGISYLDTAGSASFAADTHYAIGFAGANAFGAAATGVAMGSSTSSSFNDLNPATSLTISSTAMDIVSVYWYVMDNIQIDGVNWLHAADTATGEDTAAHLMSYDIDTVAATTGGDLSNGLVVADGSNITNAGYEQVYYQSLSVDSTNKNVDAGKVILFTFASDTVNSDYSINATVKYHIR